MQALRYPMCLMAMLSSIVMGFYWRTSVMPFDPRYPRIDVPVASHSVRQSDSRGPIVSLSRDGEWVHGDAGVVSEAELRGLLSKERDMLHGLGLWANVRVRIGKDAPARHFLAINRIAVECGYEQMIVSVVRPNRIIRRY